MAKFLRQCLLVEGAGGPGRSKLLTVSDIDILFAWDNLLASYLCFKKIIWQIGDSKEVTSLLPISFLVKVSFLLMCWLKSALDKCPRCQGYLRVLGKLNGPFHPHHALVAHIK